MNIKIEIKGIKELVRRYSNAPKIVDRELEIAFNKSLMTIQREVKLRTPVDTGRLRSSIGNYNEGWKWITSRVASIGTKVKYAYWVEVINAYHKVGQVGYFSKGVQASMKSINEFFSQAMKNVADKVSK